MNKKTAAQVNLRHILRTLADKKISFVLTGAHAIGGWTGEPRATKDIDLLVKPGRNHARVVKAIRELYPQFDVKALFGVTAFFVPGETQSVIDVAYPHRPDIEETLKNPIWVEDAGLKYRIPALECALANKYGAMLSGNRDPGKRQQDAADFTKIVRHSLDEGQQAIDEDRLRMLGEKVWSDGGGSEVLWLVEEVKRGRFVDLNALVSRHG